MMRKPGSQQDPRADIAVDMLMKEPTLMVTHAMRSAGFSMEESKDRAIQMRIRRRIPTSKARRAGTTQLGVPTSNTTAAAAIPRKLTIECLQHDPPAAAAAVGVNESAAVLQPVITPLQNSDNTECIGGGNNTEVEAHMDDEFEECKLQTWISGQSHSADIIGGGHDGHQMMLQQRTYLEQSVQILYSLAEKIIIDNYLLSIGQPDDFITVSNIIVRKSTAVVSVSGHENNYGQLSADFITRGDGDGDDTPFCHECDGDETQNKYAAMHAFAHIAYALCLRGNGPELPDFILRNVTASESSLSIRLSLRDDHPVDGAGGEEEDEIMDMIRKHCRGADSEEIKGGGYISAMLDAGVPLPMRRFVSDLLGDEQGGMFRSDRAFTSFEDVLSDLKQMVINPDNFLHGTSSDRWKVVFDDKLYGRDAATEALMIAADRVTCVREGALGDRHTRLISGKKSEVVMVSGHSGAGKSRLVWLGGVGLEKRGWLFLRCKFDRVAHPEPLSVLAHALDDYIRSLAMCPKHGMHHNSAIASTFSSTECSCSGRSQQVCARLKSMIFPQGLGMLAKHIPSLKLLLNVVSPLESPGLNESMMASLFRQLLQAISSKQAPVLFFLDDLQWADPLSLSVFVEIVKEARPDLNSSVTDIEQNGRQTLSVGDEKAYILFVGSYRDNEVNSNYPLAKVLHKFRADNSINMTDISLPGLPHESLNEMLSDTLALPIRRVRPLTELVIQKTDGHPLHVIEFIQALAVNNLLTHSFSKGWEWDADSIDIFPITDSVAELYSLKLQKLPKDILLGIQILSCFGFQVDQQVLDLVAYYDGSDSVDMNTALQVAINEGLIERACHLISFTHDMILKATIDSIRKSDFVPLLRKLIAVLIKEASASGSLDSVLFVAVDLINRIGSESITVSKERALFAELNLRAATAAIAVPDFAGAARYAENGISLLSDTCWETQYDLCIRLYEASVLSLYPSLTGDRSKLMQRVNDVFEHATNFTDKFKTHIVWVQILVATDISKGIEECIKALLHLGEPLDLDNVDHNRVCSELVRLKTQYSDLRLDGILSTKRLVDTNKVRAMKAMSLLLFLCNQAHSLLAALVCCKMVELSMTYGTSDDSIHGIAAFASALVNISGFISEGITWGRTALLLLKLSGDKPTLIPPVYAAVYGSTLVFAEPMQSSLEPLSQCVRLAYDTGNTESALAGPIYYLMRSFGSGKNIRMLIGEVDVCLKLAGCHFGCDASFKTPSYKVFLRFFFTPLYNVLHELEGDVLVQDTSFPFNQEFQPVNNHDTLKAAIEMMRYNFILTILCSQVPCEFLSRNMERALKYSNMYFEFFIAKPSTMLSGSVINMFYDGLINFYFLRQTGDERYKVRGVNALHKFEGWVAFSEWNFKNKQLLLEAEFHYSMKNSSMAATCYEASIKAAKKHKFIHEEALSNELAGLFFLEEGQREKALSFFEQSAACYRTWGGFVVARRVEGFIEKEFGIRISQGIPSELTINMAV